MPDTNRPQAADTMRHSTRQEGLADNRPAPDGPEIPSPRLSALLHKDPQVRGALPEPKVWEAANRPGLTYDRVIASFLSGYADRPALAERAYEVALDNAANTHIRRYKPEFAAITYAALQRRIRSLAMAWRTHPHCRVHRGEQVAIMGFAGIDYAVLDMACAYAKAVCVPLSGALPSSCLRDMLHRVEPVLLAASVSDLPTCVDQAIERRSVRNVLVFDHDPRVDAEADIVRRARTRLATDCAHVRLFLLDDLMAHGDAVPFTFLEPQDEDNDGLAMIMHTSGSTGKPKGACIKARALINTWSGEPKTIPKITVIMQPFHHNMGRNEMYDALSSGGLAHFTLRPDMSTVFEDIRLTRPVSLVFLPRVLEMVHQYFQAVFARRLSAGGDRASVKASVMSEMRTGFLGDRLLFGAVASAPLATEIKRFMLECFGIDLVNGYSATEVGSGGLALNGRVNRKIVLDYKLVTVPELGYFTTDKPHPRGELCVKTKFGITEYYNQPEATAQLLDEGGYYRTGDIVEELGLNHIAIIDRKANVVKLSQGEYVAVGKLAKVYESECPIISQMYIHGDSQKSFLLAVVVPDLQVAGEILGLQVTERALRQLVGEQLIAAARRRKLKSFEVPKNFILETERFTCKNGLLSAVNKYLTPALRQKYGPRLEALYRENASARSGQLAATDCQGASPDVKEGLARILRAVLDRDIGEDDLSKTFYELGGDSLAAVLVSLHIKDIFGVHVGGDSILSPTGNLRHWTNLVASALTPDAAPVSFEAVHGPSPPLLDANALRLKHFIDPAALARTHLLPASNRTPRTVVLTGANGFLGRYLSVNWLQELAATGGKLICLVRSPNDAAAKARLNERFAAADESLSKRWEELAAGHLEVLACDIASPRLGLGAAVFARLAEEADLICHAGALVNHRLSYQHLFGPNVVGVSEVIRLAVTGRRKAVDFISTIGLSRRPGGEAAGRPALPATCELSDAYASGYVASKWAGEHLLIEANRTAGIPVNIFRCDFIMPHRRHGTEFNPNDLLSRLIYSILATGLAPMSFYSTGAVGRERPHFGGVPIDILARAIVGSHHGKTGEVVIHNATNATQDISLDTFVEWMAQSKYSVRRINYKDWRKQVEIRLAAMPPQMRRHSIADMLDAFNTQFTPEPIPTSDKFKALVNSCGDSDTPFLLRRSFLKFVRALDGMVFA